MFRSHLLGWIGAVALSGLAALAQDPEPVAKRMPVIAVSGDTEISSIRIQRERASDAAIDADLTNMEIRLWLTSKWEGEAGEALLRVTELAPILDSTGKLLSTKARLERMDFLHGEVRGHESGITRGRQGPVIRLLLDAPARQATTIQSIKGKAMVSQSISTRLEFADLQSLSGKPLNHPKLKNLQIVPTISVNDGDTVLSLHVPNGHARLMVWGIVKNRRMLDPSSESTDGITLQQHYDGDQMKDSSLGIMIAEPSPPKVFEFDFKNVELP
jgi:hypothetical protein